MANGVHLKDYLGYPITVTQDGRFSVTLPGRDPIFRQDLESVEKEIAKLGTPVKVFALRVEEHQPGFYSSQAPNPRIFLATEMKGSKSDPHNRLHLRKVDGIWSAIQNGEVFLFNEELVAELRDLSEREEKAVKNLHDRFAREEAASVNAIREEMRQVLGRATSLTKEVMKEAKR